MTLAVPSSAARSFRRSSMDLSFHLAAAVALPFIHFRAFGARFAVARWQAPGFYNVVKFAEVCAFLLIVFVQFVLSCLMLCLRKPPLTARAKLTAGKYCSAWQLILKTWIKHQKRDNLWKVALLATHVCSGHQSRKANKHLHQCPVSWIGLTLLFPTSRGFRC